MRRKRILYYTSNTGSPASQFFSAGFGKSSEIHIANSCTDEDLNGIETLITMAFPSDGDVVRSVRLRHPNLRIGITDVRGAIDDDVAAACDFFVADSIETEDFVCRYHRPVVRYYEYPDLPYRPSRTRSTGNRIVLGYHGNRVHLDSFEHGLTSAIEKLADDYDVELRCIYNVRGTGQWERGLPQGVNVQHIQWSEENLLKAMEEVDIGLAPALMPIRDLPNARKVCADENRNFLETDDDYLLRFKVPSNPGRIIVFSLLKIPVITDFFPSGLEFVRHNQSGKLACSADGWYAALRSLADNPAERTRLAANSHSETRSKVDYRKQNKRLLQFLRNLPARAGV